MTTPGRGATRRNPSHLPANAPLRRLWTAVSACALGDWLTLIALTAFAAARTADSGPPVQGLAVGGVFLARLLPPLLLDGPLGALSARFDRRLTMAGTDVLRLALVVSVPLVGDYRWAIAVAFLLGCVSPLWASAKDALLAELISEEQAREAERRDLLLGYGTAPLAAVLFAVLALLAELPGETTPDGPAALALYGAAFTCLASAVLILLLRPVPRPGAAAPGAPALRRLTEGRRRLGGGRAVGDLITGMLVALVACGAVLGVGRLHTAALGGGDASYGMLFAAVFAGLAAGMFGGGRLLRELSRRRLFALAVVAAGAVLAALALVHELVLGVLLAAVLGLCAGVVWAIGHSLIAVEAEDGSRGRTLSFLRALAQVALVPAVALAPALGGLLGARTIPLGGEVSYWFDGVTLVLLAGALAAAGLGVRALRRLDDRPGVPLAADLAAALRGERPTEQAAERMPGMFIAFEGGEGSGKTTQSRLLAIWLRDQGYDVVQTREPGSTKIGMRLRAILLDSAHQGLSARAETLLYAADRAEHVEKVIRPALRRGALVVCDRYVDSSLAYQGAGRELAAEDVARVNVWATEGLTPDLTVLLDVPPQVGMARFASPADRIEAEPLEFHERVRREFRALAAAEPERYLVVDGTLPQEEISRIIQDRVREMMPDPVPEESEDSTSVMPAIRD